MTMRFFSKALFSTRRPSLPCVFAAALASTHSKNGYIPLNISVLVSPSSRSFFNISRFVMLNNQTTQIHLKQYTDTAADGYGEFDHAYYASTEKTRLYPGHDCEVINQVLAASSCEEILQSAGVVSSMDLQLASQTVVSLYEALKSFYPQQCEERLGTLQAVQSSSVFQKCHQVLESQFNDLSDIALLDVFLALSHIISEDQAIITKCLLRCQELIQYFDSKDLSKFCITMMKCGDKYLPLIAPAIGRMLEFIQQCKTEEDIRNIAICLGCGIMFASPDCLASFARQVEDFILNGNDLEFKTAINCLTVLIFSDDHLNSMELQQLLISFLIGFVPNLNTAQLRLLFRRISLAKCNTSSIVAAVEQRLNVLLQECKSASEKILLLNCTYQDITSLNQKFLIDDSIKKHPELCTYGNYFDSSLLLGTMYNIFPLQNQKLSKHLLKLCCSQNLPIKSLRRIVKELLYFRKITGFSMTGDGIQEFTKLSHNLAEHSVKCYDIALFSSFVITDLNPTVPVTFIQRLSSILPQLSIPSLSVVSLSLSIAFSHLYSLSETQQKELSNLSSDLLKLFINLLPSCKSLLDYNSVLRNITDLISNTLPVDPDKNVMIHDNFFDYYNRFLDTKNFNIHSIISTCKTISHHRICLPRVLDAMAQCIVEHPAARSAKTITYLLQACYHVNYSPKVQDFFAKCQDIITSDHQFFSCYGLLQSALSLGLNGALNDQIMHLIFSKDFLERLEKELSVCNISQARSIRMAFARLNKIVCLDYPEENVPWFHEQYFETLVASDNPQLNQFEKEVYRVLCQVLPGKEFIRSKVYTPYYYLISFEVFLDKANLPLETPDTKEKTRDSFQKTHSLGIQRVAVDVLPEKQYCGNMPRLIGHALLKKRHLEILGYKLVQVPFFEWNSLQLSNNESRVDYLYTKIFQST